MGKKIERNRSKTLPSSPTHSFSSSSSSDFEFRISLSPRKSSAALCPADELFYKGQLLPLHLSPRISMVRTLLLASSSTSSSSDATTSASRDSSSSNDSTSSSFAADLSILAAGEPCCDSSRPSSATEEDNNSSNPDHHFKRINNKKSSSSSTSSTKYFSLSRFSNVFKKDNPPTKDNGSSVKKMSSTAKDVFRKYLKKVKPLYEKLSPKQQQGPRSPCVAVAEAAAPAPVGTSSTTSVLLKGTERSTGTTSFSGNLKCSRMIRRSYVASCPSSMRSSPNHSGVLNRAGLPVRPGAGGASTSQGQGHGQGSCSYSSETSTMEELQNAIQGAIAHCKNSMLQTSSSHFKPSISKCKAFEI